MVFEYVIFKRFCFLMSHSLVLQYNLCNFSVRGYLQVLCLFSCFIQLSFFLINIKILNHNLNNLNGKLLIRIQFVSFQINYIIKTVLYLDSKFRACDKNWRLIPTWNLVVILTFITYNNIMVFFLNKSSFAWRFMHFILRI